MEKPAAEPAESSIATARHTPGPWLIDHDEYSDGDRKQIPVVQADHEYGIADVRHWSGSPENWANAHLIAAAPELKAELQVTDPLCQQLATVALNPEVERYLPHGLLNQVMDWLAHSRGQAAIAKAEGRAK